MSIIFQRDATIYSFIIFLQTAVHVSGDTLIHHQEHTQTVITTSGTGRTVFATIHWHGGVRTSPPQQRTVANTVRPVPDVVTTVCMCSWWWMRVSSETRRAVLQKYDKTVHSRILLDNYWQWLTMHGPMNVKFFYHTKITFSSTHKFSVHWWSLCFPNSNLC